MLTSCTTTRINYKNSLNGSIRNIQTLKNWISYDEHLGKIDNGTAYNYYYILEVTEEQLKRIKNDKQKN